MGYVGGEELEDGTVRVTTVIEKPGMEKKPSDHAIFSGYIFTPEIFDAIDYIIENKITGPGGEYIYTDALNVMLERGESVHAVELKDAKYYDTGNKLAYMKTVTEFALKHPEISEDYRAFLKELDL